MNVWGVIDHENGSLMTEMEHFIRKPEFESVWVVTGAVMKDWQLRVPTQCTWKMAFCSHNTLN